MFLVKLIANVINQVTESNSFKVEQEHGEPSVHSVATEQNTTLMETIRKLNNHNALLEMRFQELQEQYHISKDQVRELQLSMKRPSGKFDDLPFEPTYMSKRQFEQ